MLLVVVAVAMGVAGVAWVATRTATPTGGSTGTPPVVVVPRQDAPPETPANTNSRSVPVNVGDTRGAGPGKPPNGNDLLQLAGKAGALLGGQSAFTNTAKDASAPVGLGVATIAILAGAGSSLSVAAMWAAPIVLVTVAIITIIDGIVRTDQANRWRVIVMNVRDLRASGQIREALEVYRRAAGNDALIGADESGKGGYVGNVGGEISQISRTWPQPGDDWFNTSDPLGRPYPGFPGPPAPASLAEIAANPSLLPETITTVEGQSYNVRQLLADCAKHSSDWLTYGLTHGIVGELPAFAPGWGTGDSIGKAATDETRPLATSKTGPRDISKWPELIKARREASQVAASILGAFPWLAALPIPSISVTGDLSAQVAAFRAANAKVEKARRVVISNQRNFGGTPKQAAAAAAVQHAETAAEAAERTAARARGNAAADTAGDGDARTGSRPPVNRSGSGGRNG